MKATIVPQGKKEENCKRLTKFQATNANGDVSFPPIKFPCLRVQLDADGEKFVITWSHFYHDVKLGPNKGDKITSECPGKFKLRSIAGRRPFIYERDQNSGRIVTDRNGRPVFDFLAMQMEWGTEAVLEGRKLTWNYGPDHPMIEEDIWAEEYETLESLHDAIVKRFDSDLADQIVTEFMEHELYAEYDTTLQTVS